MSTFVLLHAHPDDEAIFTGGTIARLSLGGHRVVVIFATSGELGRGAGPGLAEQRRSEAAVACGLLGVDRMVFLDHQDSGMCCDGELPWGAFTGVEVDAAAVHVAAIAAGEGADVLVTYDARGVYGHPDHIHAHLVGETAARIAEVPTWYESTIDREYLHFVDTHVANQAGAALATRPVVGTATVEITTTIDVRKVLDVKLAAIAAHRSQVSDPTFGSAEHFDEVYGYEWFVRHGPATALDELAMSVSSLKSGAEAVR